MLGFQRFLFFALLPLGMGFVPTSRTSFGTLSRKATEDDQEMLPTPTSEVVNKVGVAGATGRTGQLVVEELLSRNVKVVAMVRSLDKAKETFPDDNPNLEIVQCDLTSEKDIQNALDGCDSSVWCATGFSDAETGFIERLKRLAGIALAPKQSIDSVGIPIMAKTMMSKVNGGSTEYPKVVMLSSAGVTRPQWDDKKKERLMGSADIPIVRLNPFGILDVKAESEEKLRQSGVNYCIVRPCGLNDSWPSGSRPVFSQGDVAVGRINRKDVATVLVDTLAATEACGKTFEVVGIADYAPTKNIGPLLANLKTDKEGVSEETVEATYFLMQQLLPGERQDSAALAMGQTYEQLDKGEEGRLGERGKENVEAANLEPTSA